MRIQVYAGKKNTTKIDYADPANYTYSGFRRICSFKHSEKFPTVSRLEELRMQIQRREEKREQELSATADAICQIGHHVHLTRPMPQDWGYLALFQEIMRPKFESRTSQ